jgi:ribosomal protein S18 acetylase RimI-like enzyme
MDRCIGSPTKAIECANFSSPINFSAEKMDQSTFRIRTALSDDVPAIITALEQLSNEIPLKIDTEEGRTALRNIVAECCEQSSWVAPNEAGNVVGFLLARKYANNNGVRYAGDGLYDLRPECEFEGFTLPFGGVLEGYRRRGLFSSLLSQAKALKMPLQVDVSHTNTSDMAARLLKEGFVERLCSLHPNHAYFIWTPTCYIPPK